MSDDSLGREPGPVDPAEYRTAIKVPLFQYGAVIGLFWLFYALRLAGIDSWRLLSRGHTYSSEPEPIATFTYLWAAVAVTVFGVPLVLYKLHANRKLLRTGLRLQARFVSRGIVRKHGMYPVTFAYVVNGVEYKHRRDVAAAVADGYGDASRFPIIVDPARPSRCVLSTKPSP